MDRYYRVHDRRNPVVEHFIHGVNAIALRMKYPGLDFKEISRQRYLLMTGRRRILRAIYG